MNNVQKIGALILGIGIAVASSVAWRLWWAIQRQVHDRWYWLKCWLWHRYDVVVCRPLPPTWVDRDYLLVFAAFQILEDYVNKEDTHFHEDVYKTYKEGGYDEDRCREEERDWNEIRVLYGWWQKRKAEKYADDYDQDNEMLHRLINVRKYLWT